MAQKSNLSSLKEFFSFIATVSGDLSNITAPPFLLASSSIVESPSYWAEHPSIFTAPANEPDAQKRALLVLRWFLSVLKRQFYVGREVKEGVKKPLNAFLGEVFFGQYREGEGKGGATTKVIAEQVSHHPPITACYVWSPEAGVHAEGYSCQETTFSGGNINIKQIGHAILHIDEYNEDYLIPLPNAKAKGFFTSGPPYPELTGTYYLISSSGFTSEVKFIESGMLSGARNRFEAMLFRTEDTAKTPIFTVSGQWSGSFVFKDGQGVEIETYDTADHPVAPATPLEEEDKKAESAEQDPWESRKAWQGVITALEAGDMQATIAEKSKLEEAQRELRKKEQMDGVQWEPVFFSQTTEKQAVFDRLAASQMISLGEDKTKGVWVFDTEKARRAKRPYHGELTPFG